MEEEKKQLGWIKLYRAVEHWEWYTNNEVKSVFFHCLIKASRNPRRYQGVSIPVGGFTTTIERLSAECGNTIQETRTALKKLTESGELTVTSTNKYTLIMLNNWAEYQFDGDELTNNQLTNNQQTTNNQLTNNQQTTNNQLTNNQQTTNNQLTTKTRRKKKEERRKNIYSANALPSAGALSSPSSSLLGYSTEYQQEDKEEITDEMIQRYYERINKQNKEEE